MNPLETYATYQRETSVSAARPVDLVLMVFERLLEHLREAQRAIAAGEDASVSTTKALDLITQGLQACLDKQRGGEIAQNLSTLYQWAVKEILLGRLRKDAQKLSDVVTVMDTVAQAWRIQAAGREQGQSVPSLLGEAMATAGVGAAVYSTPHAAYQRASVALAA